jgi:hypothetical protein
MVNHSISSVADTVATPAGSQARKLIAATIALVGCRIVSLGNSMAAGFAAVTVVLILAVSIIAGMPRVRRMLLIAALPASVLANAVALGIGSFVMLLGTQGLLVDGRIGHQGPPWNVAFTLVPLAAAANLLWLARPALTARWPGRLWLVNLASAAYSAWCWRAAEGFSHDLPLPVAPAILLSLAILSMATLTWQARARASSGTAHPCRGRCLLVSALAALIFGAIWVALFPAYRNRELARSLETFGWHANVGVILPGWKLPIQVLWEWHDYLGEIDGAWAQDLKGDVGQAGRVLNSLPWLASVAVEDLDPGASRILQPLAGQTRLRQVDLMGAGVTDETLADAGRIPGMNRAVFDRAQITDAGLANLAGSPWLQFLAIRQTPISGEGVVHLRSLPRLTELDLSGTDVGDRQVAELRRFKGLVRLTLDDTRLTDDGLASLARCKTLKRIALSGTRVTESGVAQLRRALPNCNVVWQRSADQ